MFNLRFILFLLFVFNVLQLYAHEAGGNSADLLFLNVETGLPSRNINTVFYDHKGMLWIATDRGLCVYNGKDLSIYSHQPDSPLRLSSSVISDVAEDEFGRLWICTSKGLCVMSADRGHCWPASAYNIPDSIYGKGNTFIEVHPQGGFWFLAGTTLYRLKVSNHKASFSRLGESPFSIYARKSMIASKKGELWILSETSVAIWTKTGFKKISYPIAGNDFKTSTFKDDTYLEAINILGDSLTLIAAKNSLFKLTLDKNRAIWRAEPFDQKLLESLPAYQDLLNFLNTPSTDQEPYVLKEIFKDRHNNYWITTSTGVYGIIHRNKKLFKTLSFVQNQSMRKLFQDKEGNIWFNSYSGLTVWNKVTNTLHHQLRPFGTWDVIPIDSNDYMMCYDAMSGLGYYRKSQDSLRLLKAYPIAEILDMVKIGDQIWMVNGHSEVLGFDLKSEKLIQRIPFFNASSQVIKDVLKSMMVDASQNIWVGGASGLFFLQRLPNGLYEKQLNQVPQNLRTLAINTLYLDRHQQIWIGTKTDGLVKYQPQSKALKYYRVNEGLAHPTVFSIQGSGNDQFIWVGTQNGLSCLNVRKQEFLNFFENSGLPDNEFNTAAHLLDKDGILYMGGIKGVAYLNPDQLLLPDTTSIQPYVELYLNDYCHQTSKAFFPEHHAVVRIKPNLSLVELRFLNSNILTDNAPFCYRYKIEGLSSEWHFAKSQERILLSNLKFGEYKLVLSVQNGAFWSEPYTLNIKVLTPWYYSKFFFLFATLLGIGTIYLLYRLRIAQIRREYHLRKQISDDLHDDLGTRIYALKSLAYQITHMGEAQEKLDEHLNHFEDLSKETLLVIRNFIWAFNPKNDDLQHLLDRMEKFVETVIRPNIPNTQFVTFSTGNGLKMKPGVMYHGLRVFQEVLTNMVKHTEVKNIEIDFKKDDRFLLITVTNSYSEFKKNDQNEEHYGQESLEHRIKEVGGRLDRHEGQSRQYVMLRLPFE